jgi:hypothetical protein
MAGSFNGPGLAGHPRRMLPVLLLNYIGNLKLAISFYRDCVRARLAAQATGKHSAHTA